MKPNNNSAARYKALKDKLPKKPADEYDRKVVSYLKKKYNEDLEPISELKKSTLGSYAIKAKGEMGLSAMAAGAQGARGDVIGKSIDMAHAKKRSKGVDSAIKRLTKEENNLDEAASAAARFNQKVKQAQTAHEAGDHKKAKYHLDTARNFMLGINSNDHSKIKDSYPQYKKLRDLHTEEVVAEEVYEAADTKPGWMLRQDPVLAKKVADAQKLAKKRQASYGDPSKGVSVKEDTFKQFRDSLVEKTLTPAEKKKREDVAKAIERENPGMPMGMKMAIATKTAKRVAESQDIESVTELSSELLARYKKAASTDASAADAKGDVAKGNKRFSGIMKATKKQFSNDMKTEETWYKTGKEATHIATGQKTYEYQKVDKEGKPTGERHYRNADGKVLGEEVDDEGKMAKGQLMRMVNQASALAQMMEDDKQLDGWVQSKLTMASDYLDSVHDYLMHNKQDVDEMDEETEHIEEGSTSHADLAKMANDAYVAAIRQGNSVMAAHYLKQHMKHKADAAKKTDKIKKMAEDTVLETKGAPKGFHFTKDGKLKRGDANQDGDGGPMLRSDPLDKQRNKIPAVSEAQEGEQVDELNQMTLSRYAGKARSVINTTLASGEKSNKTSKMIAKRAAGVRTANRKMAAGEYSEGVDSPVLDTPEGEHLCAKHVYSNMFGEGVVVDSLHAEPDEEGNIEWYAVQFEEGIKKVFTEKLQVMTAEYHGNHKKKRMTNGR